MWASIAIEMRSRNLRPTRALTTVRYHVSVADAARPTAATRMLRRSWSRIPSVSSVSQTAMTTSGSIVRSVTTSEVTSSRGSTR